MLMQLWHWHVKGSAGGDFDRKSSRSGRASNIGLQQWPQLQQRH
jgi:hypothetical protein